MAESNITHFDISKFLSSGAYLRDGGQILLLTGPFSPANGLQNQGVSVSAPAFFETEKLTNFKPFQALRAEVAEISRELLRFIDSQSADSAPSPVLREPSLEAFEKTFARVQNLISQGQIEKAVPVVFAESHWDVTPLRKAKLMLEALRAPKELWAYGFWNDGEGFLGATPEILFRAEKRELETMALAGTLAKADGRGADLLKSTKDMKEHLLVVEDLKRELTAFGHVVAGETGLLELPALYHLKTDFQVHLHDNADGAALIKALHPTAALGVFPRRFGWRWMRELAGQDDRARFGAPLTFTLENGGVVSLVAIRNVQWKGPCFQVGSGCGVVHASELKSEWNELFRKRESVLRLLGLIQ